MDNPLLFALAVLAVLATPGPTNTLLATSGAMVGVRRSLALVPAEAAGYSIAILTLGLVLGPVMAGQPLLAAALRAAVGAYLLLLAWRLWRRGAKEVVGAVAGAGLVRPGQLFLTTLLNPKAIVFALGIVPFGKAPVLPYMLGFLALLAAVAVGWIALGALLGRAAARRGVAGVVPRIGATAVAGFGVLLLVGPLLR
ncbi:LysE family transporter [Belnapia rosea]|uniref:LysE family transporter n=1 Tax=Belnapia rosea TaxID=938405 RepID=UPI0008887EEA|nr:LysE family transporter [Belnapia rosea]SDB61773.1 Threonine/homoserine/homoserine lactone efflux protein [Belnapia rosea]